uniref:Uncharacterized protein n=1 Tax=Anopheles coluzzii TaxID=1518534 RepID=A0A8W7Q3P8_ANOCL
LKDLNISQLITDIMALIRDHGILLPPDMAMLFKALITLEGLGRQLDPDFQLVEHITPFVRELLLARYHPKTLLKRGKLTLQETLGMLTGLPRDILRLSKDIRQGKFRINLDLQRLDSFGKQLDRSTNRLTMAIVTGCLIIGSSIVMTVNAGPKLFGLPFFGFIGFMIALFNSVWLICAAQALQLVELNWRAPSELQAALQPQLRPDERLSAMDNQLIIDASPAREAQLAALARQLDVRPVSLRLEVSQSGSRVQNQSGVQVQGNISIGRIMPGQAGSNLTLSAQQDGRAQYSQVLQNLTLLEGRSGFIQLGQSRPLPWLMQTPQGSLVRGSSMQDAITGFYARPRLNGQRVSIELGRAIMNAMLVGADTLGNIPEVLQEFGITIHRHLNGRNSSHQRKSDRLPAGTDLLILFTDFLGHNVMRHFR